LRWSLIDGLGRKGEAAVKIYGDTMSGNCLKVRYVADHLGLVYDWVPVDIMKAETRTPEYLARFPAGQVRVRSRAVRADEP